MSKLEEQIKKLNDDYNMLLYANKGKKNQQIKKIENEQITLLKIFCSQLI